MRSSKRSFQPSKPARLQELNAFGEVKTLAEWSRDPRCLLTAPGLRYRLAKGIKLEEALTAQRTREGSKVTHDETFEAFGEEKSLAQWLADERCLVGRRRLLGRIREGVTFEKALGGRLAPPARPPVTAFSETKTIGQWARDPRCEVSAEKLRQRLKCGFDPELAMCLNYRKSERTLWEAFGEQKTSIEWARDPRCQVSDAELRRRLLSGIPTAEALIKRRRAKLITAFGERKTISEWGRDDRAAVSTTTITNRLAQGYPPEMAISAQPIKGRLRRFWHVKARGIQARQEASGRNDAAIV